MQTEALDMVRMGGMQLPESNSAMACAGCDVARMKTGSLLAGGQLGLVGGMAVR